MNRASELMFEVIRLLRVVVAGLTEPVLLPILAADFSGPGACRSIGEARSGYSESPVSIFVDGSGVPNKAWYRRDAPSNARLAEIDPKEAEIE